ncbi:MAG: malate dehydrogenase [Bacteroidales bacterium]|nr:malate dehydrogenase [Bacteroidales bacterium]
MKFLTDEKLVIVGAAGMIGSNILQSALMMHLTPNICAYDPYEPGLEGAAEEMYQSDFKGVNLTWTSDIEKAFHGARYIISSGGAPRKGDMTREDLLRGNAVIAKELGENIKKYCPDVRMVVIVFNPADITGLVTLIYSGIAPNHLCTLAALDSTRLKTALAQALDIPPDEIKLPRTYGGHGEQMAVFASQTKIGGAPLKRLIGTPEFPKDKWEEIKKKVIGGGKRIIDLRCRSSFQSPAFLSVEMMRSAMGGTAFEYPVGCYVDTPIFSHIVMAVETTIDTSGVHYTIPQGEREEMEALETSYKHLCQLRDEVISMGVIPPINKWHDLNPHLIPKSGESQKE